MLVSDVACNGRYISASKVLILVLVDVGLGRTVVIDAGANKEVS